MSKFIAINDMPPVGYALWQSFIAATILTFMAYCVNGKLPDLRIRPRYFLVCGLVGTAIPNVIFFISVRHIPAGTMAIMLTLVPIFVYLLVLIARMERVDALRLIGVTCGFIGALIIAIDGVSGGIRFDTKILFAMLCPLGYAVMGVFVAKQSIQNVHPFHLAAGTHIVSTAFLLPIALVTGQFHPLWDNPGLVDGLVVFHGLLAAVSYALFFKIVKLAGAVFYSFSHYVIALMGLLWGWLLFGEIHGPSFWIAVLLILGGLTLVNFRQQAVLVKNSLPK